MVIAVIFERFFRSKVLNHIVDAESSVIPHVRRNQVIELVECAFVAHGTAEDL